MHLFNKLIAALTELKISKEDWRLLAELYAVLPEKNFAVFEKFCLMARRNSNVCTFMRCYFDILAEMNAVNNIITAQSPKDEKPNEDDRALIISSLLTDNLDDLKMMAHKVEWLSIVAMRHQETQTLLRLFLRGMSLRLRQLTHQPTTPRESSVSRSTLHAIFEKTYNNLLIKKLIHLCTQYQNRISDKFISYLKDNDQIAYFYYFKCYGITRIDTLFRMEEDAARFSQFWREDEDADSSDNLSMVKPTLEYAELRDKYIHITNLLLLLNRNIEKADKCTDAQLLQIFLDYFAENNLENIRLFSPGMLFFSTSYYAENELIKTYREITKSVLESRSHQPSYSSKGI